MGQPLNHVFSIQYAQISDAALSSCKFDGNLDADVAKEISLRLQLTYHADGNASTEMCFVNSPDIRPEFKVSFTGMDLSDYVNAWVCDVAHLEHSQEALNDFIYIPYPTNADEFWKLVEVGKALRRNTIS